VNRVTGGVRVGVGVRVEGVVDALRDRINAIVEGQAVQIYLAARERWPVRTGRSRSQIFVEDVSAGPVIAHRVGNTSPYARFIRSTKLGEKARAVRMRFVLTRELGDPVRAARRALPGLVAPVVRELLEGGDG
jgi:hypothetical protein